MQHLHTISIIVQHTYKDTVGAIQLWNRKKTFMKQTHVYLMFFHKFLFVYKTGIVLDKNESMKSD